MYKKYILLFTFMFGLYSHSHEEFFRNNKIIISIKKIPVNFEKNSDIIHRFPFDEYYISEKFEILKINFSPLKNRENIFNGIYQKNITHKELSPQLITNLENLLKKMHQIKMEDNNLSISESPNEEAQLKLLTTSFNSQQSILFHIGHEISGKQDNEIHNVKFDSLYQVEFLHNTGTISIIVGSDSKIYKNEVTKNLIIFINNFIKEME